MATEKKEIPEEEELPAEPPKKPRWKWVIFLCVGLLVIGAGATAGWIFFAKAEARKTPAPKPAVLSIWPMDAFVINIAGTNGERYLKIVIELEISDPGVGAELNLLKPRLRDSILDLLTARTLNDLMDLAGKQRLREDIAGRINNALQQGKVSRVFITDFVIQ